MLTGKLERVDGLLTGGYLISIYSDYDPHLSGVVGEGIVFDVKKVHTKLVVSACVILSVNLGIPGKTTLHF